MKLGGASVRVERGVSTGMLHLQLQTGFQGAYGALSSLVFWGGAKQSSVPSAGQLCREQWEALGQGRLLPMMDVPGATVEKLHSGMKTYGCELCGKRFLDSLRLRMHLLSHSAAQLMRASLLCNAQAFQWKHSYRHRHRQ
ncbi:hypothetical protein P4O66_002907 [Electrophorus voltai]|uniref:C2H2-type domain-containing protein n=1 Tax=Electrophorus voltai TaxID=2609070 RepID=A0AAD8YWW4_9TELE|nr:hypothetical protein P4O66_002907 [Electrophorus voltai]